MSNCKSPNCGFKDFDQCKSSSLFCDIKGEESDSVDTPATCIKKSGRTTELFTPTSTDCNEGMASVSAKEAQLKCEQRKNCEWGYSDTTGDDLLQKKCKPKLKEDGIDTYGCRAGSGEPGDRFSIDEIKTFGCPEKNCDYTSGKEVRGSGVCSGNPDTGSDDTPSCSTNTDSSSCLNITGCIWIPNDEEFCGYTRTIKSMIDGEADLSADGFPPPSTEDDKCLQIQNPSEETCNQWGCVWDIYGERGETVIYDIESSGICKPPMNKNCMDNFCHKDTNHVRSSRKTFLPDGKCEAGGTETGNITIKTCTPTDTEIVSHFTPGLMSLTGHSSTSEISGINRIKVQKQTDINDNTLLTDRTVKRSVYQKEVKDLHRDVCEKRGILPISASTAEGDRIFKQQRYNQETGECDNATEGMDDLCKNVTTNYTSNWETSTGESFSKSQCIYTGPLDGSAADEGLVGLCGAHTNYIACNFDTTNKCKWLGGESRGEEETPTRCKYKNKIEIFDNSDKNNLFHDGNLFFKRKQNFNNIKDIQNGRTGAAVTAPELTTNNLTIEDNASVKTDFETYVGNLANARSCIANSVATDQNACTETLSQAEDGTACTALGCTYADWRGVNINASGSNRDILTLPPLSIAPSKDLIDLKRDVTCRHRYYEVFKVFKDAITTDLANNTPFTADNPTIQEASNFYYSVKNSVAAAPTGLTPGWEIVFNDPIDCRTKGGDPGDQNAPVSIGEAEATVFGTATCKAVGGRDYNNEGGTCSPPWPTGADGVAWDVGWNVPHNVDTSEWSFCNHDGTEMYTPDCDSWEGSGDAAEEQRDCEAITGCVYTAATPFICDLDASTNGTGACSAGCTDTAAACTGTATEVTANCTGTATEVTATCTGSASGGENCDLDANTDSTAECPSGCDSTDAYTPTCDLTDNTDSTAECPAGCTFTAASTPTCDLDEGTDDTAECPEGCADTAAECTGDSTAAAVPSDCNAFADLTCAVGMDPGTCSSSDCESACSPGCTFSPKIDTGSNLYTDLNGSSDAYVSAASDNGLCGRVDPAHHSIWGLHKDYNDCHRNTSIDDCFKNGCKWLEHAGDGLVTSDTMQANTAEGSARLAASDTAPDNAYNGMTIVLGGDVDATGTITDYERTTKAVAVTWSGGATPAITTSTTYEIKGPTCLTIDGSPASHDFSTDACSKENIYTPPQCVHPLETTCHQECESEFSQNILSIYKKYYTDTEELKNNLAHYFTTITKLKAKTAYCMGTDPDVCAESTPIGGGLLKEEAGPNKVKVKYVMGGWGPTGSTMAELINSGQLEGNKIYVHGYKVGGDYKNTSGTISGVATPADNSVVLDVVWDSEALGEVVADDVLYYEIHSPCDSSCTTQLDQDSCIYDPALALYRADNELSKEYSVLYQKLLENLPIKNPDNSKWKLEDVDMTPANPSSLYQEAEACRSDSAAGEAACDISIVDTRLRPGENGFVTHDYTKFLDDVNNKTVITHKVKKMRYKSGKAIIILQGYLVGTTNSVNDIPETYFKDSNDELLPNINFNNQNPGTGATLNDKDSDKLLYMPGAAGAEGKYTISSPPKFHLNGKIEIEIDGVDPGNINRHVFEPRTIEVNQTDTNSGNIASDNIANHMSTDVTRKVYLEEIRFKDIEMEIYFDSDIHHLYKKGDVINVEIPGTGDDTSFKDNFNEHFYLKEFRSGSSTVFKEPPDATLYSKVIDVDPIESKIVINNIVRKHSGPYFAHREEDLTYGCIDPVEAAAGNAVNNDDLLESDAGVLCDFPKKIYDDCNTVRSAATDPGFCDGLADTSLPNKTNFTGLDLDPNGNFVNQLTCNEIALKYQLPPLEYSGKVLGTKTCVKAGSDGNTRLSDKYLYYGLVEGGDNARVTFNLTPDSNIFTLPDSIPYNYKDILGWEIEYLENGNKWTGTIDDFTKGISATGTLASFKIKRNTGIESSGEYENEAITVLDIYPRVNRLADTQVNTVTIKNYIRKDVEAIPTYLNNGPARPDAGLPLADSYKSKKHTHMKGIDDRNLCELANGIWEEIDCTSNYNKSIGNIDVCENTGYTWDEKSNVCTSPIINVDRNYCTNKTLESDTTYKLTSGTECPVCSYTEDSDDDERYCQGKSEKDCMKLSKTQCLTTKGCEFYIDKMDIPDGTAPPGTTYKSEIEFNCGSSGQDTSVCGTHNTQSACSTASCEWQCPYISDSEQVGYIVKDKDGNPVQRTRTSESEKYYSPTSDLTVECDAGVDPTNPDWVVNDAASPPSTLSTCVVNTNTSATLSGYTHRIELSGCKPVIKCGNNTIGDNKITESLLTDMDINKVPSEFTKMVGTTKTLDLTKIPDSNGSFKCPEPQTLKPDANETTGWSESLCCYNTGLCSGNTDATEDKTCPSGQVHKMMYYEDDSTTLLPVRGTTSQDCCVLATPPTVTLTFDADYTEIVGSEASATRTNFETNFKADMVQILNDSTDVSITVTADMIEILDIVSGSIIVTFRIKPDTSGEVVLQDQVSRATPAGTTFTTTGIVSNSTANFTEWDPKSKYFYWSDYYKKGVTHEEFGLYVFLLVIILSSLFAAMALILK